MLKKKSHINLLSKLSVDKWTFISDRSINTLWELKDSGFIESEHLMKYRDNVKGITTFAPAYRLTAAGQQALKDIA